VRALPVALTVMDQANAGIGSLIFIGDHKHIREDPAGPVNLSGEMRAAGLMEPEEGSTGIVQASGVPGAG
jgi:hypothetical protein